MLWLRIVPLLFKVVIVPLLTMVNPSLLMTAPAWFGGSVPPPPTLQKA